MPGDAGVNPAAPWTAPAPGVAETVPAPNAAPWTAPPPVPGPAVPDQATSVPGPELVPQSYSYPAGPTYRTPAYWYGR